MGFYYCVDIGGTQTKCGIIDDKNKMIFFKTIDTAKILSAHDFATGLSLFIKDCEKLSKLNVSKSSGLGIGLTGLIDSKNGIVNYSKSLNLVNYKLVKRLSQFFSVEIKIANDAELATQAEIYFGIGKKVKNFVMLTLGTGVGCGIVINGKSLRQSRPFACELGHNNFLDGEFEHFASSHALNLQTKTALEKNKNSKIWNSYNQENMCGKAIFDFLEIDQTAKNVFDKFISYVGDGIVNIVNTLCPEVIVIGGAISNESKLLTKPIEQYVNNHIFGKVAGLHVKVISAKTTKYSGLFGAKTLFSKEDL